MKEAANRGGQKKKLPAAGSVLGAKVKQGTQVPLAPEEKARSLMLGLQDRDLRVSRAKNGQIFKSGHSSFQNQPLAVETGQHH
jgi:hypothetical protein